MIICCGQTDFCGHFVRGKCGQNVMWTIRSMCTKRDFTDPVEGKGLVEVRRIFL